MNLQDLLGSLPSAVFMEEHYCKLPYAGAGGCAAASHLGTWDVLGELLAQPQIDLLVASDGGKRWQGELPTTAAAGRHLVSAGYTLGVRHAHRHHAGLASLADDFRREFCAPIDVHLYCTPAAQPGFSWHYDAEEVFVLQTAGVKEWSLRKNTVNPWPLVETLPSDMHYEREIMPLVRCTLKAGDWLYIPSGYWHSTRAIYESISLSIGVKACSAMDIFDWLRPQLLQSLLWRQRLPPLGPSAGVDREELTLRYRALLDQLASDLAGTLRRETTIRAVMTELEGGGPGP